MMDLSVASLEAMIPHLFIPRLLPTSTEPEALLLVQRRSQMARTTILIDIHISSLPYRQMLILMHNVYIRQ